MQLGEDNRRDHDSDRRSRYVCGCIEQSWDFRAALAQGGRTVSEERVLEQLIRRRMDAYVRVMALPLWACDR